ncbi:MAG: hypothetical protein IT260_15460 [Saprospiraceae bacterium]|nr:hypothetical protein [Saprospiraceae bacterium]
MTTLLRENIWLVLLGSLAVYYLLKFFTAKMTPTHTDHSDPNQPAVSFQQDGRSGRVGYTSKEGSFDMYFEFGGDDVLAIIDVPEPQHWVAKTGIPLERRDQVLATIGRLVVESQTHSGIGSFEVQKACILIRG